MSDGNRSFFSLGAGLNADIFEVDFSYISPTANSNTKSPLSNTVRVGLILNL
jgi:hypothetical protein